MKGSDYITILAPMVQDLNLKGNSLLVFALVHGFTKDGEHRFSGSLDYIQRWTNLSRTCVVNTLRSLVEDGFLNKYEQVVNGVKFCSYDTNYDAILAKCTRGTESVPGVHNVYGGGTECVPNIDIYIDRNNTHNKESKSKRFSPPSVEDVRAYCRERCNTVDPQRFVDFYESKGWMVGSNKMKDWKAAVRTWESKRNTTTSTKAPQPKSNFTTMVEMGLGMFGDKEKEVADEQ